MLFLVLAKSYRKEKFYLDFNNNWVFKSTKWLIYLWLKCLELRCWYDLLSLMLRKGEMALCFYLLLQQWLLGAAHIDLCCENRHKIYKIKHWSKLKLCTCNKSWNWAQTPEWMSVLVFFLSIILLSMFSCFYFWKKEKAGKHLSVISLLWIILIFDADKIANVF